ncbi:hypothetical protein [Nannocystis punicea]|uniref:Lycopene cyclase domain-containing protein n=1 Tax=Nannocystis punicea TaxID=2995304 RepID=A0ABY7GRY1_9BACT|nr:hypothetical protein [Nannocystis poenicansa]WAS89687.1 hypothetical protein O0S08_26130 [Nannocystis poenicansa]
MSMRHSPSPASEAGARLARPAYAVLVLTSVHHVYGALLYQTPWRYHAVLVSLIAAALMAAGLALARARPGGAMGRLGWWLFVVTTVAIPLVMIGAFEGVYNHVFKNLAYFGGASPGTLARLFPPPTYELPDDLVFELTGILQVAPAALVTWRLVEVLRAPRAARSPVVAVGT